MSRCQHLLLALFCCVISGVSAQEVVKLKVINNDLPSAYKLYLRCAKGPKMVTKAVAHPTANNEFVLDGSQFTTRGICELNFPRQGEIPIVLGSDTSAPLELGTIDWNAIKAGRLPLRGDENKAYLTFNMMYKSFQADLKTLRSKHTATGQWDDFNGFCKEYLAGKKKVADLLSNVKSQYPSTYVGATLSCIFNLPQKIEATSYASALHDFFFEAWDLSSYDVVYNQILTEEIDTYFDYFGSRNGELYHGIDLLMDKAMANDKVKEYIVRHLMKRFLEGDPSLSVYVEYLYANYVDGCMDDDSALKFEKYINVRVGVKPPNISMPDKNGAVQYLHDYIGEKPVLVYVWKTSCPYCQHLSPKVEEIAKAYGDKIQIVGFSLDKSKTPWLDKINQRASLTNWIDVCDFKAFKSPAFDEYFIPGTPDLLLLDKDGLIVSKTLNMSAVKEQIANLVAEK